MARKKKITLSKKSKSYSTPWFETKKGLRVKLTNRVTETITTLALCKSCKHFKRNKPATPIFINGFWWGGPDAGLCKREKKEYDSNQHRVDTDSCEGYEISEVLNCLIEEVV